MTVSFALHGLVVSLQGSVAGGAAMKRFRIETQVACPFSAAIDFAKDYFRLRAPGVLRVPLRLGPVDIQFNRTMTARMIVCTDRTDLTRKHEALEIRMHPLGAIPFPEFSSTLTVRPHMPPGTLLALEVSYRPPLGILGSILDAALGRRVALGIARALPGARASYLAERNHAAHFPAPASRVGVADRTNKTGTSAVRTTCSATLPRKKRCNPRRP